MCPSHTDRKRFFLRRWAYKPSFPASVKTLTAVMEIRACSLLSNYFPHYRCMNSPATAGEKPPPGCNHSFISVDGRRAVMFGGYAEGQWRANNVYIIDLYRVWWVFASYPGQKKTLLCFSCHVACSKLSIKCNSFSSMWVCIYKYLSLSQDSKETLGNCLMWWGQKIWDNQREGRDNEELCLERWGVKIPTML